MTEPIQDFNLCSGCKGPKACIAKGCRYVRYRQRIKKDDRVRIRNNEAARRRFAKKMKDDEWRAKRNDYKRKNRKPRDASRRAKDAALLRAKARQSRLLYVSIMASMPSSVLEKMLLHIRLVQLLKVKRARLKYKEYLKDQANRYKTDKAFRDYAKHKSREWGKRNQTRALAKKKRRRALLANASIDSSADTQLSIVKDAKRKRCFWCGGIIKGRSFHMDHVVPLSKGGDHAAYNLVVSCPACNLSKGARMPNELTDGQMVMELSS